MKNHEQFVLNSLKILLCDIQRIEAVCNHADLAVAGPNVADTLFNKEVHDVLIAIKFRAIDASNNLNKLLDKFK